MPGGPRTSGDAMNMAVTRGVTMIELMVVITIVAILMAVGVPSFRSLILSQKVKSAASDLQTNLYLTRAEALKRNATVTLKPNSVGSWATGWNVSDQSGVVLSTTPATTVTITGPAAVNYKGTGRIDANLSASFQVSAAGTAEVRCVSVEVNGMSVTTKGTCS